MVDNTINRAVVQAFISRFCLFEGTWRKYHGLNDVETYLKECKRVSAEVMNSFPEMLQTTTMIFFVRLN